MGLSIFCTGQRTEQSIMNLENAKIFLCIVIGLTICQYTRSQDTQLLYARSGNVTYNIDDIIFNANYQHKAKIAGGVHAKLGDFPYLAVVHRLVGNGLIGQCGGTIISKRWVLTAGHCVIQYPRRFFVVFGIIDKSLLGYDFLRGRGISMITTKAFIHPQYKESRNDIALLYMPDDIPFSNTIQPIQLAHYESFANRDAFVIGWGKDRITSKGTTKLMYAAVPIIENNECIRYWRITDNHICTAAGIGRDACQGDSGGPLIVVNHGRDLQIGIVSYGDAYCPSNLPGVFTRVSSFIDWIHEVIAVYKAHFIHDL